VPVLQTMKTYTDHDIIKDGNLLVQTIDYNSSNGAVNVSLSQTYYCWCLFNLVSR